MNNSIQIVDEKQEQRWHGVMNAIPSKGHEIRFHNRSGKYKVMDVVWRFNHYGCNITVYVEEL